MKSTRHSFGRTSFLRLAALCLALMSFGYPSQSHANTYAYGPLVVAPTPSEVLAFSPDPPPSFASSEGYRQLTRDGLLTFLREGTLQRQEFRPEPETENVTCEGVLYTRNGQVYTCTLINSRTLRLITADRCMGYLALDHNATTPAFVKKEGHVTRALIPPKAAEVAFFANAKPPSTGFQINRKMKDIQPFLESGEVLTFPSMADYAEMQFSARVTLPPAQAEQLRSLNLHGTLVVDGKVSTQDAFSCTGTIATKGGKIYFWEQWADNLLRFSDATGAECVLKLPN